MTINTPLKKAAAAAALLAVALTTTAQTDEIYLMEIGGGVGLTAYEGDFNGSILSGMQPTGTLILRRAFGPYMNLRFAASASKIEGSSDNTDNYLPDYADTEAYDFSRTLIDAGLTYEYNFWPYGTGADYRGARRLTPFIMVGLGLTVATGNGTDATANMPLGLGVKYKITKRWNLGVEWAMHFSLSDTLDGVADPYSIASSGIFKNTDCYSTLQVTLTYSFLAKCRTCHNADE